MSQVLKRQDVCSGCARAGSSSGAVSVVGVGRGRGGARRNDLDGGGSARVDAEVADFVQPSFQNLYLDDDFGFRAVDILDHLFGEIQFVWCIAHDDRVLRVERLNALQVQQLAQTCDDFGDVLGQHGVGKIEGAHDLLFVVAALLRLVGNDEDDVLGYRLPDRLALQRDDVQRLLHVTLFNSQGMRRAGKSGS